MESVAEEILREILLKLPTRDVARCGCVCKLWHHILGDRSFRRLHAKAAHVISGAGVEALLLSQRRQRGMTMENTVFSISSAKLMCRVTDLADAYGIAGVCNSFVLLASGEKENPVFVCNPIIGGKFKILAPPVLVAFRHHFFAMGFSASTNQYKIFRVPFQELPVEDNYLDVYTLGNGDIGWSRHPDIFHRGKVCCAKSPPVLVDGKLYVVVKQREHSWISIKILVIDVASEASCTYSAPQFQANNMDAIDIFELGGEPCVAMHVRDKLCLWVMPTPRLVQGGQQLEKLSGDWVCHYIFISSFEYEPRGIWVDDNGILCCIIGDQMYKYNTTNDSKHKDKEEHKVGLCTWDHKLCLPSWPSNDNRRHRIYGGYRPNLLSPRVLAAGKQDKYGDEFENTWLRALECYKSNKGHDSPCVDNGSSD